MKTEVKAKNDVERIEKEGDPQKIKKCKERAMKLEEKKEKKVEFIY